MISKFNYSPKVLRFSIAIIISIIAAFVISILSDSDCSKMLCRGDYPAFYAAGNIASSDTPNDLYDIEIQKNLQNTLWPNLKGDYLFFAYPPTFAIFFKIFSTFNPIISRLLFLLFSLALLYLSAYFLSNNKYKAIEVFALALLFPPITTSIASGQNTVISICLLSLIYYDINRNKLGFLGVWASLLLFKPQLSILVIIYLFLLYGRKVILSYLTTSLILFLITIFHYEPSIFLKWINALSWFAKEDYVVNGYQMVSFIDLFQRSTLLPFPQKISLQITILVILAYTLLSFYRIFSKLGSFSFEDRKVIAQLMLSYLFLFSIHLLFYDLGIIFIVIYFLSSNKQNFSWLETFAVYLLLFIFLCYKEHLPLQPSCIVLTYLAFKQFQVMSDLFSFKRKEQTMSIVG
ncbi:MAG: DUF2029 domain-containing protein [Proteobacteria bacterium]|nr:DUF2029 domain-containing protein [Pseudomonadota bacterium]